MEYQFWGWQHADAKAITDEYKGIETPIDLYDALTDLWCADTCAPRMRDAWTKENMTLGQCSITAFLAQDIFGGKVYGILRPGGNYHCFNVIGDCRFDLTSEQFTRDDVFLDYEDTKEQFREVHFAKEEKRLRYEYLKQELKKYVEVKKMNRKDFGAKPYSFPQPVFIIASYDEDGTPCAMNAAWCGISDANEVSMCLSAGHKTTKNILNKKAFTISMADAAHVAECDYFGIATGNKVKNKIEATGLTVEKSANVDAPIICELAVCMECKLISYDEESCIMKGEIINVSVDESALTDGKVDVGKVAPITFDPFNNAYHVIGEKVGEAWNSGKKFM